MADEGRKSSEDLVREANQRFRTAPSNDPAQTPPEPVASEPGLRVESGIELPDASDVGHEPPPPSAELPPFPEYEAPGQWDQPSSPPKARSALSSTAIRWVIALVVFGGSYLIAGLGDASRDADGEIVSAGSVDVGELAPGDCFDDAEDFEEVVYDVEAVPCSGPHDNEVFAIRSAFTAFPSGFPGQEPLQEYAYETCSGVVFEDYVGVGYLQSSLEVFSLTPTEESWQDGDREFACVLYRLDLGKLTGTARASGL